MRQVATITEELTTGKLSPDLMKDLQGIWLKNKLKAFNIRIKIYVVLC